MLYEYASDYFYTRIFERIFVPNVDVKCCLADLPVAPLKYFEDLPQLKVESISNTYIRSFWKGLLDGKKLTAKFYLIALRFGRGFRTVEKVYIISALYWFSLPFAYKRKRECEVSPPAGEVARSARGASLAQHITACYKCDVEFCAKLTKDQSPHHSARWRAVKRFKSAKGVWG